MEMDEKSKILDTYTPESQTPTEPDVTGDTYQLIGRDGEDEDEKLRSNIPMTTFNFINSIIGSGIIGMPYALKQAGFGLGVILIIAVALLTDYSVMLLIHGGSLANTNSYQGLVQAAFGKPGFFILTFMQFLYPFIAMISYNVIIGDVLTKLLLRIFGSSIPPIIANRNFVVSVATLLITLPLSLYRNIAKLSKASLVSIVFVIFIIGVMIGKGFDMSRKIETTPGAWSFANYNITQAIGIMAFAYMCHHNSFLIYDSLQQPSWSRWHAVTHLSIAVSMLLTLVLGITGYATFTGYTQGDVLENYCRTDDLVNAARVAFAVTIMLTYPVECFVTREVLENSIFIYHQPQPLWRHIVMTVIIVFATVAFSMATDCLGIVLELNGVLAAAPLAFILPPLCVMRLQNEPIISLKNIPNILVAIFGIGVASTGFVMALINIQNGDSCSHGNEMPYCLESTINVTSSPFLNKTFLFN